MLVAGTIRCWGSYALGNGQYRQPVTSPVTVSGIDNAVAVTMAGVNTCALLATATVRCWGQDDDSRGFFGDGFMPEGHGPQVLPHPVIGFGASAPTSDDQPPAPVVDQPVETTPPTPNVVLPPKPTARTAPTITLRGSKLVFAKYVVATKGSACPRVARVTVKLKAKSRTITWSVKVKRVSDRCTITARLTLPAITKKLSSVKVGVSGSSVRAKTVVVRRAR